MNLCECGCEKECKNRFINHHNLNGMIQPRISHTSWSKGLTKNQLPLLMYSEERNKKIGLTMVGHLVSKETAKKIGLANLGKKHSLESRRKTGEANKGRAPYNKGLSKIANPELNFGGPKKGHVVSEITREKMRQKKIGVPQTAESNEKRGLSVRKTCAIRKLNPVERIRGSSLCTCLCGDFASPGKKFISGHNAKGHVVSAKTREKIKLTKTGVKNSEIAKAHMRGSHVGAISPRKGLKRADLPEVNFGGLRPGYTTNHFGNKKFPYDSKSQGIIKMRSRWEVLYAIYLDSLNIEWIYEPEGFKLSDGHAYIPDFYLPGLNEYHEIKGWMRPISQKKINLFVSDFPEVKFKILRQKDLVEIGVL